MGGAADRSYSAADLAALRRAYYDDGVLSSDALAVEANDAMSVTVAPGAAVIAGYTYILDEPKTLAVTALSGHGRNDLIVLRLDLGEREIIPAILTGTNQGETPAPSESGDVIELALASLSLPASASAASDGTLTDMRPFAAMRVMDAPFRAMLDEALAALPKLNEDELASARSLIRRVVTDGAGDKVLCDDGRYRGAAVTKRVELARYDEAGEYEFDPAENPSATGTYDIELIGGGGAGGSTLAENSRGGGGGAGAYVTASSVRLFGKVGVTVGEGGSGAAGTRGGAGGESIFGPLYAEGGGGGSGGEYVSGGYGGETSPFFAESGEDGSRDTTSVTYLDECGAGAASAFGAGAAGDENAAISFGKAATSPGAGGSGAGGPAALSSVLAGGKGADGMVVVYGYIAPVEGE